ncbi:hypothetical protein BH09CHL1_BH09CHL1_18410 [soil metagenome]
MLSRRSFLALSAAAALGSSLDLQAEAAETASWKQITGSNPPSPRWDHTLSADIDRERLIVTLGRDDAGIALGDSFVADRATGDWQPIESTAPGARFGHAVAVDRAGDTLYLFGGQNADAFFNDLWALNLESLSWELIDDGASGPTPRYGTSLVFDEAGGLIVSHGFTFEGRLDDTWRFDTESLIWTDVSPAPETRPLRRCLHEAVWNASTSSMWLYGGCSSGYGPCPQGDLWEFRDGIWASIEAPGPTGRMNPALIYDRALDSLLLFGGQTEAGRANDLWLGNGDSLTWNQISTDFAPEARSSHDAVYSASAVYMFGGLTASGAANDLWRLKLSDS